jgi:hypothetical protein
MQGQRGPAHNRPDILMSEHQSIIVIISVIVITILIWVGFGQFLDAHRASQKDDFLFAMNDIGASAVAYRQKPKFLGGGGGEYLGFALPGQFSSIDAGTISAVVEPHRIVLVGHSRRGYGTVAAEIDASGELRNVRFDGEF